jgi:hypothetical protein
MRCPQNVIQPDGRECELLSYFVEQLVLQLLLVASRDYCKVHQVLPTAEAEVLQHRHVTLSSKCYGFAVIIFNEKWAHDPKRSHCTLYCDFR